MNTTDTTVAVPDGRRLIHLVDSTGAAAPAGAVAPASGGTTPAPREPTGGERTAAPSSSIAERRLVALERANHVRRGISEIRREIGRGEIEIADALHDPRAGRMTVYDVLRARRRCGPRIARKLLAHLQISEQRRVSELTDRQRTAIAQRLAVLYLTRKASDV
jgi:hypothetical protein